MLWRPIHCSTNHRVFVLKRSYIIDWCTQAKSFYQSYFKHIFTDLGIWDVGRVHWKKSLENLVIFFKSRGFFSKFSKFDSKILIWKKTQLWRNILFFSGFVPVYISGHTSLSYYCRHSGMWRFLLWLIYVHIKQYYTAIYTNLRSFQKYWILIFQIYQTLSTQLFDQFKFKYWKKCHHFFKTYII